ncbi:MAG: D-aminoacyl-tRNA deacylase [Paracoccaceae bacterium]
MRALIQRVTRASVTVEDEIVGQIEAGLLILICAMQGDDEAAATQLAARIAKLRIFRDADGKMNRSILDTGGAALVVSQFTLAADTRRGNRPGFSEAAPPDTGRHLYEFFADQLQALGIPVERGVFGADMAVDLTNSGPVTIWMDSSDRR